MSVSIIDNILTFTYDGKSISLEIPHNITINDLKIEKSYIKWNKKTVFLIEKYDILCIFMSFNENGQHYLNYFSSGDDVNDVFLRYNKINEEKEKVIKFAECKATYKGSCPLYSDQYTADEINRFKKVYDFDYGPISYEDN